MRITRSTFFIAILLTLGVLRQQQVIAQCAAPLNVFPYNEDFENNDGNWLPENSLHWQWGMPAGKPVITAAGSGSKCWIAGGLSATSYASGSSSLTSPCFDFSALIKPEISFKIFWETELKYDGATLLYSTDGGISWSILGAENSNDPCAGTENWFNYLPLNLTGYPGWCGNVQSGGGNCLYGQGSGQWLTARHNLSFLAGLNKVIFKFFFVAGQTCNSFDGIAIDNIHIGETPAYTTDFSYTCGAGKEVEFNTATNPCDVGWSWNFGDIASGAANVSPEENPTHIFSSAGTYNVSLLVTYGTGAQVAVPPKTISVADVTAIATDLKCGGAHNGSITSIITPPGMYNYSWNTSPVQTTASLTNLDGNRTYTLTLTAANTCTTIVPVFVKEPPLLLAAPLITQARCGKNNGSISVNVTGGTVPYTYVWSTSESNDVISSLSPGSYDLSVKDINGCIATLNNLLIQNIDNVVDPILGNDTTICPGQMLLLRPGSFASYKWQDSTILSTYTVTKTGDYSVAVTDADGCTGTSSAHITVDCKGIYFPSAFTPGTDNVNAAFGPLGDVPSLRNYSLAIYNRLGEKIFISTDAYKKWDGNFKGKPMDTQSVVWIALYKSGSQKMVSKTGTVLLIR